MIKRAPLDPPQLESICQSIAASYGGLTGSEIGKLLSDSRIPDIGPTSPKWQRLYNAFGSWQNRNQCSNNILNFLKSAMQPIRYIGNEELFEDRRHEINKRLSFIGVSITNTGALAVVGAARTISDAEERASHYKYKLLGRNVHDEVIKYCDSELLKQNYFHSVFEGVKSIAQRLRIMTGVHTDGNELADLVFSTKNPLLQINALVTDTDRNEHIGLMNMIKGLFGLIRNPTAHTPKILFEINEAEALDIMTIVSYVHRKLDNAF